MIRRLVVVAVLFLSLLCAFSSTASAVQVKPMALEVSAKPGERSQFELSLTAPTSSERVQFSLFRLQQQRSGSLGIQEVSPDEMASPWVKLPEPLTILPGAPVSVAFTVNPPPNARGSSFFILMVESSDTASTPDGIMQLQVAYGVRVGVRVQAGAPRPSAEVAELGLRRGAEGRPVAYGVIRNKGDVEYVTSAEMVIRDSSRRLVQRLPLTPPSYSGNSGFRLYPGSEVEYVAPVSASLPPGDYDATVFLSYASGQQVRRSQKLAVREGDFSFPRGRAGIVRLEPAELSFQLKPGETKTQLLSFTNTSGGPLRVMVEPREIAGGYPHSAFSVARVALRGGTELSLAPHQTLRSLVTVMLPKEAKPQGYYGYLSVKSYNPDGTLADEQQVGLAQEVPGPTAVGMDVLEVQAGLENGELNISVALRNTGETRLSPTAQVTLVEESAQSKPVDILLGSEGDSVAVFPDQTLSLIGTSAPVRPGPYTATVRVCDGKRELTTMTTRVEIK